MSKLREAAKEALRWMEHARLHLTIKERMHPDGLHLYDSAAEALRAALAQPETESEPVAWQRRYIRPAGPSGWLDCGSEHDWHDVPAEDVDHYVNRSDCEVRPLYAHPPRDEWRPASEPPDTTRSVLIWLRFGDVETFGKTLGGPSGFAFQNGAITHWRDVTPPTEVTVLPDGSAFGVMSFPLPIDHWLCREREYLPGKDEPVDLPRPVLTHALREHVVAAVRYAVRGATNCGMELDFDPDALVLNAVYALCGPYCREDSCDTDSPPCPDCGSSLIDVPEGSL